MSTFSILVLVVASVIYVECGEVTPLYFLTDSLLSPPPASRSHYRHQQQQQTRASRTQLEPMQSEYKYESTVNPPIVTPTTTVGHLYPHTLPVYRDEPDKQTKRQTKRQPLMGLYGDPDSAVPAAVVTRHRIHYYEVPTVSNTKPTTIEVGVRPLPINILLRSSSSQLNIEQLHEGGQGSFQETKSEDPPHILKHTVTKPVIQEIYELITPYRKIRQELQPVQEIIDTIIAKQNKITTNQYESERPSIELGKVGVPDQVYDDTMEQSQVVDPRQEKQLSPRHADRSQSPRESKRDKLSRQIQREVEQDYMAASANSLFSSLYGIPALASTSSLS